MTNEELVTRVDSEMARDIVEKIEELISANDSLIRRYNSTGVKITADGKCLCPNCKYDVPHDRFLIPINEFCSKCGQRLYMGGYADRLIPTETFVRSLHRLRWDIPPIFVRPGHKQEFVSFVTECIDKIEEIVAKNSELLKIIEQLKQDLDRTREECRQLDRNAKATQDEYKREIERLKAKPENKPLTLDEIRELKSGEVVWLEEHFTTQAIEIDEVIISRFVAKDFFTFFSFGNDAPCRRFLTSLNTTYKIYRNKPDHIADVSKKPEDEPLTSYDKSKRQHEICRQVRKNIYPTSKSEPLKIVSIRAVPLDAIYESMGNAIANYINQHGQPPKKICVSSSLLSLMQDELAPGLKDKTIAKFMGVPVEVYGKDTTALEFYICGERHVIKFGEE